jgi:hypothetical protein
MQGLVKEVESIMEEIQLGPVREAGIIAASQKLSIIMKLLHTVQWQPILQLWVEMTQYLLLEKTLAEEKKHILYLQRPLAILSIFIQTTKMRLVFKNDSKIKRD